MRKGGFCIETRPQKFFYSYIDRNLNDKTSIAMIKVNNIEMNDNVGKSEAF